MKIRNFINHETSMRYWPNEPRTSKKTLNSYLQTFQRSKRIIYYNIQKHTLFLENIQKHKLFLGNIQKPKLTVSNLIVIHCPIN